jgi:tetratricopeptide (TPR) repeat protein
MNRRHSLILAALLALPSALPAAVPTPIGDVMAGEFALQQGDMPAAARYYLLAAQVSDDAGLAERATRIALIAEEDALAARALARWRMLDPDALAMHAAATHLALRQGEHETAMEEADAMLARADGRGFAALLTVLAEARGDDAVIARSVANALFAARKIPDTLQAWLQLAGLARRLDDPALSQRIVAAGLTKFPDDPRGKVLQAVQLRGAGDREGARLQLLALRDGPVLPPELRATAASELVRLGEPAAAAALLARGPQDDASFAERARWLILADDRVGLLALYQEMQRDDASPKPERRLLLGHLAEALDRWDEAERWYARIPPGPAWDVAQTRRARVLAELDRLPEGIAVLQALQADADADGERVRDSFALEAELLERDGRSDDALDALDRALAVFEADPVLLYSRAMLHERNGRTDPALADLRRILADSPEDPHALNAYGYTLSEHRQDYAAALPYLERAHRADPESAPILDSLGWVLLRLGQGERGLPLLRQAWEKEKDPEIAAHLGEALWVGGDRAGARAIWNEGLAVDPQNPALRRAIEKFKP